MMLQAVMLSGAGMQQGNVADQGRARDSIQYHSRSEVMNLSVSMQ